MTNLLQVSSAMGRAMEEINRSAMVEAVEPVLKAMIESKELSKDQALAAIAACAEGYAFPTNLDTNPPVAGNAPQTQAEALIERLGL